MKSLNEYKIYDAMTPKEKAQLAFKLLGTNDETTLDKIFSSVPISRYATQHPEYKNRLDGLYHAGMLWGLNYWQHMARTLVGISINRQANTEIFDVESSVKKEKCFHIALARLDDKHGLDKTSVYGYADINVTQKYSDADITDDTDRQLIDKIEKELEHVIQIPEKAQGGKW